MRATAVQVHSPPCSRNNWAHLRAATLQIESAARATGEYEPLAIGHFPGSRMNHRFLRRRDQPAYNLTNQLIICQILQQNAVLRTRNAAPVGPPAGWGRAVSRKKAGRPF